MRGLYRENRAVAAVLTALAAGTVAAAAVYARPDGESFTVLRVHTSGKACVVTSGHGWEDLATDSSGEAL